MQKHYRVRLWKFSLALIMAFLITGNTSFAGKGGGGKPPGDDPPPEVNLPSYFITFLGTMGGDRSYPNGINSHGDVVGVAGSYAFLNVADGNGGRTMIDLHQRFVSEGLITPFNHETVQGHRVRAANDINDSGQIVGTIDVHDGTFLDTIAYRYTPASTDSDGNPVPAALDWIGNFNAPRINNNGVVVGTDFDQFPEAAAIWDEVNGVTVIGTNIDVENYGIDINDNLQILGRTNNYNTRAWRFALGVGFEDIPLLSSRSISNQPHAMNELGEVVCTDFDNKKKQHRVSLFSDSTGSVDLGTLGGGGSEGGGLNNLGHVVGQSQLSDGTWRLFLYTRDTGMFNLESQIINLPAADVGRLFQFGLHMNDSGEICGSTKWSETNPNVEAYLLTPIE